MFRPWHARRRRCCERCDVMRRRVMSTSRSLGCGGCAIRGQMDSQILWKSYGKLRNWTDVSWWVNLRAHQVLSMFIIIHDIIIVYPWHGTPFFMPQGGSATVPPPGAFASLHCGCAVCYCFWQRSGHVGDQKDRACPRCQEAQRTAREQVCLFKDEGLPNSVLRNYGGFLGLPPVIIHLYIYI
jgi:hypothetical protein